MAASIFVFQAELSTTLTDNFVVLLTARREGAVGNLNLCFRSVAPASVNSVAK